MEIKNLHGYDGITTKMLKVSAPYISFPLNYICSTYIRSGTFPTCLKYCIVKPLFKKGDRENMDNYRPISLLTSFFKVFEKKIIYERLLQHINVNNILVEEKIWI
jgi:Notch-like protein